MAFPTASILQSDNTAKVVNTLPNAGQDVKANTLGVNLASDDDIQAKLGIVTETAPASDTASSGLNGRLQRIAQRLTSLIALLPATLGQTTKAASLSVALASDDPLVTAFGGQGDLEATTDTGASSFMALFKRAVTYLANISAAENDTTTDSPTAPHQPCNLIPFSPTLDTSGAYSVGDVLFATVALSIMRANDLRAAIMSMTCVDKTKQHPGISIFFYQTAVTSAAANAANNLSDADALSYMGHLSIATSDWKDLANNSFACYKGINLLLEAASGSTNVYMVGIVDAGTPTFALGDLQFNFGVVQS